MAPSTFLILETLDRLDTLTPRPQDHAAATPAPRLKKVDGAVDWTKRARDIVNLARGCNPWPGATATAPGGTLTIWRGRALRAEERRVGKGRGWLQTRARPNGDGTQRNAPDLPDAGAAD